MIESLTNPRRLITAGALLAPLLGVQLVRLCFGAGAGPASSAAASIMPHGQDAPASIAIAPSVSAQDRTVADWLAKLSRSGKLESPMEFVPVIAVAAQATPAFPSEPAPVIKQGSDSTPVTTRLPVNLTLGAVMGSSDAALAMIGGKVRRVGDSILPGWIVASINPREQSVVIHGPEGAVIELKTERRSATGE